MSKENVPKRWESGHFEVEDEGKCPKKEELGYFEVEEQRKCPER